MKIAHIILTHGKPQQLERLVAKLSHPDVWFFIHVDLKTDAADYKIFDVVPNVCMVKNKVNVHWGGYSIVQATINACKEIIDAGIEFDYVNLLSGQDYPLKSHAHIFRFLSDHSGKAFMEFYDIADVWQEAIPRLEKYYLTDFPFKGSNKLERIITAVLPKRKIPNALIPVGRSQWFTIPLLHIKYIVDYLDKYPSVKRFFKFTWGSDEIVFQTILFNSPYRDFMVNDNLRYIDWTEKKASPRTFALSDVEALTQTDKLFARKFNISADTQILDYLDGITH